MGLGTARLPYGGRLLVWEKALPEAAAIECLRRPKNIVQHLGLEQFHYLPYSLRRGGATSAYKSGATFCWKKVGGNT